MADARSLLRAAMQRDGSVKDRRTTYRQRQDAFYKDTGDSSAKQERVDASPVVSQAPHDHVAAERADSTAKVGEEAPDRDKDKEDNSTAGPLEAQSPEAPLMPEEPAAPGPPGLKRKATPEAPLDSASMEPVESKRARTAHLDQAWAEFQRTVLEADAPSYDHATISAEAQTTQAPHDAEESESARRARLDRAAREEILSRMEDEQRAQEEGDERYV